MNPTNIFAHRVICRLSNSQIWSWNFQEKKSRTFWEAWEPYRKQPDGTDRRTWQLGALDSEQFTKSSIGSERLGHLLVGAAAFERFAINDADHAVDRLAVADDRLGRVVRHDG